MKVLMLTMTCCQSLNGLTTGKDCLIQILAHIDSVILKINKGIPVIKKLRHSLPRKSLVAICKAFLRTLIDCGVII